MGFNDESTIDIELDKSSISFDAGAPGEMILNILGNKMLSTKPISFGAIEESVGYHKKFRQHNFLNTDGYSVDTETIIPVGAEPKISRTMDIVGNHVKFVTDILTRGSFPAGKMSVDDIQFYGEWKRFGVIKYPKSGVVLPEIEWTEITDDITMLYQSGEPFLLMLLESVDGHVVEVGTGDDLWRWNVATTVDSANSEFLVENEQGHISLKRDVLIFDDECPMPTQTWRFKWYIAWEMKADRNDTIKVPTDAVELDISGAKVDALDAEVPAFSIPQSIWKPECEAVMNGVSSGLPCMHTKSVGKFYRNWFRSAQKRYQETKISLSNMEPHLCDLGSHVNKRVNGSVMHWDMISIFDFWLWANKQAGKNEGRFVIVPPVDSVAAQLPSMRGLSR